MLSGILAVCLLITGGCRDSRHPLAPDAAARAISDAAHGGQAHFYFLPPLVKQPSFSGTFDASQSPVVRICRWDTNSCGPLIAEFTTATGPGSEMVRVVPEDDHYITNWHTDRFDLASGATYRILVRTAGRDAGHADVRVVGTGRELRNVDSDEAIPLLSGRTLPIKFRIEVGFGRGLAVPKSAPDTVPAWVFARENLILIDGNRTKVFFPRNVIGVRFRPNTLQDDRVSAIALVDGIVIGGRAIPSWPEGVYYVQVPGDSTGTAVEAAASRLRMLPQVGDAYTLLMYRPEDATYWRLPDDGPGFRRSEWKVRFDSRKPRSDRSRT